jgi:hypothetical protein
MRRAGILCAVASALLLAGCGGGRRDAYSLEKTKACLEQAGYQAVALKNRYLPGSGGNLRVQLDEGSNKLLVPNQPNGSVASREYVFLVFGADEAAAEATRKKAIDLAVESLREAGRPMTRTAVRDGVAVDKNVFYYSAAGALTDDERHKVAACLR